MMRYANLFVAAALVLAACGVDGDEATVAGPVTSGADVPTTSSPATSPPAPATSSTTTTLPGTTSSTTTSPPSEGPPPEIIPDCCTFVIVEPDRDARVDDHHCRFAGLAEPGITLVAAGRYPVPIADDGAWETTLVLNPGGNLATFTAFDASGREVDQISLPVYYDPPLELRPDGLGDIDFMAPMPDAMERLVSVLGEPDHDHLVTRDGLPPEYGDDPYLLMVALGYPAWDFARFVEWESAGLEVMFSDYTTRDGPRTANMNGWIATDSGRYGAKLHTAVGVGVGASLADLEAAYGEALSWYHEVDVTGDWHFDIRTNVPRPADDEVYFFYGRFSGDPAASATVVKQIQAGFVFDEC